MTDIDMQNVFIEDTQASRVYTKWTILFVWFGIAEDGEWIVASPALARWVLVPGYMSAIGTDTFRSIRELRPLTPENVRFSGLSGTEEIHDYTFVPRKFQENT